MSSGCESGFCWKSCARTWQSISGESWQSQSRFAHVRNHPVRHQRQQVTAARESSWHQLDQFNLEDSHIAEVPSFLARKVAPDFLIHVGRAVSRQNGKQCGRGCPGVEVVWVILAMLVHRPKGVGSVGRAELVHRFDDFQQGHWEQL